MNFKHYEKPASLDEAYALLVQESNSALLGGGAWLKFRNNKFDILIDLSSLELDKIKEDKEKIIIGANCTLRQVETNELVIKKCPMLVQALKTIMGMTIRNLATIGGSIAGKFSFSDILAPLLVMETNLVFYKEGVVSLQEFLSNKKFPKDILISIEIKKENYVSYYKTVKKTALDFAVLNIAILKGEDLRIAVGARPGIATRAFESEKKESINDITNSILDEISLSSNTRASVEYRKELLKVYIQRGLKEVFSNEN